MDDDKILDITYRRSGVHKDAAMTLADALSKVVAAFAPNISPEDQLLGIVLCAKAVEEVLSNVLGGEELQAVLVAVNRRSKQYVVELAHGQTARGHQERKKAEVVPIHREKENEHKPR